MQIPHKLLSNMIYRVFMDLVLTTSNTASESLKVLQTFQSITLYFLKQTF